MLTKLPNLLESLRSKTALTVATVGLTLAAASSASAATVLGFQGVYAPSNWTFTNTNADGFVNTSGAPNSISLTGGNTARGSRPGPGTTDYTTTAPADGKVIFDWNYSTVDIPGFDPFGSLLNGAFTQLAVSSGSSGTSMFDVKKGDVFGFRVATTDNLGGSATATISNFQDPPNPAAVPEPTPEPSSVLSLLALGALGAGIKSMKRN